LPAVGEGRTEITHGDSAAQAALGVVLPPLILPDGVLPGNGEVRDIFPHLDEAQLN
jgi:hypothetical protein